MRLCEKYFVNMLQEFKGNDAGTELKLPLSGSIYWLELLFSFTDYY